jgi:hypothetical protein
VTLRALIGRIRDHRSPECGAPPPGTTHVLYFTPPGCPPYPAWYLVPVTDFLGGCPPRGWTFLGGFEAEQDLGEKGAASFATTTLGFPVTPSPFHHLVSSEEFPDGRWFPGYYLIPG